MRQIYYCPGGGLGHIARAHRVMAALAPELPYTLISASPALARAEVRAGAAAMELPRALQSDRAAHRAWLQHTLRELAPCTLWVDAFPAGIVGELCAFAWPRGVRARHVARRLVWERYARRLDGALPGYERIHAAEYLPAPQAAALAATGAAIEQLELPLDWPGAMHPQALAGAVLVVHSGPAAEVAALVDLARRELPGAVPRLVACAATGPAALAAFPAWPMFAAARRIYSGAGFNAVLEARAAPHKHRLLAFARALDDQHARLAEFHAAHGGPAAPPPQRQPAP